MLAEGSSLENIPEVQAELAKAASKEESVKSTPSLDNQGTDLTRLDEKSQLRRETMGRIMSDREFKEYIGELGLDIEGLRGKTVLDLGAGETEKFARGAIEQGINVVSVSPMFQEEANREILKEQVPGFWEKWKARFREKLATKDSVAALAQELPFKDNSFDAIVSLYGIPHHLPDDRGEVYKAYGEIIRVLKSGGTAYLSPIRGPGNHYDEFGKGVYGVLEREGVKVDFDSGPGVRITKP